MEKSSIQVYVMRSILIALLVSLSNFCFSVIPPSRNRLLNSPSKEFCPVRQHEENTEVDTAVSEKRAVELASVEALHCLLGVSAISGNR